MEEEFAKNSFNTPSVKNDMEKERLDGSPDQRDS